MNNTNSITQEKLKEVLDYNPDTGIFTCKLSRRKIKAGDIAGYASKSGYVRLTIDNKKYLAHRLAWLYVYGVIPKYIDHINRIASDNRICNLREATHSENMCNRKIHSNNKSSIKNVGFCKKTEKWRVKINVNNKKIHIGYFDDLEFADLAATEARNKYHGEFANRGK
jgi:hypothetical protein